MEEKLKQLRSMTEGRINELGYDLYHVEFVEEDGEEYLRFYIENKTGETITLDDCAKVSRNISTTIDQVDPIESAYFLEVSSPGLFRELFTPIHIKKAIGERVQVRLHETTKGKKNFIGILEAFDGEKLTLALEEDRVMVDCKDIRVVHLEPVV